MKTFTFTNGKKPIKTYKEISNKDQGCFKVGEVIIIFATDNIKEFTNEHYSTTFEEVN